MIICVDWGGSLTKVVVKYIKEKDRMMEFERFSMGFPYEYVNDKINEYTRIGRYEDIKILVTGAQQGKVDREKIEGEVIFLGEIEAIGHIVDYCGFVKGLVVSIGTGTPFVYNDGNEVRHVNGTGLGGGTLIGLGKRLIGVRDPEKLEEMAGRGQVSNVNITMSDVAENSISWLKQDYTCSNFGKAGFTHETQEDISLGIHSIVAEPIGCLAAACAKGNNTKTVIFVGTLSENKVIQKILNVCLEIYGMKGIFPEHSGYGTCLGAIALYEGK